VSERGRLFLVACPRSGTTLLQCLLAAHPRIASYPESHFFPHLVPAQRWRRALGLAKKGIGSHFHEYLHKLGRQDLREWVPAGERRARPYARAFAAVLDRLTEEQGKDIWLEKTPVHLLYIRHIRKLVPEVRFIHMVRSGEDVVASLYEVTGKYPKVWGGARGVDESVDRWLRDVRTSRRYLKDPDHALVRYEDLVTEPGKVLEALCAFIGVAFDEQMLADYAQQAGRLVLADETWKAGADRAIENANAGKFYQVFDEDQQQRVRQRLGNAELEKLFPA